MTKKQIDAYEHFRSAWYGDHHVEDDVFDEVRFGRYSEGGGPAINSVTVQWRQGQPVGAAQLSVSSADWPLLYQYRKVLQELATVSNRPIAPADVTEILLAHGFLDVTEVVDSAPLFDLLEKFIRGAVAEGDTVVPDAVVDLSEVAEAVRSNRAKLPHAPGDHLPTPEYAHMPWESAVYEHPLEGEAVRRRNIYASQERSEDGRVRITFSVVDMGLVKDELIIAYYGACRVLLNERGVMASFERDEVADEHEVLVADGQLLELVFPALVANHLLNTGRVTAGAMSILTSDALAFSGSFLNGAHLA